MGHYRDFKGKIFSNFMYLFLVRGKGREKKRERNIDEREKRGLVASHMRACNQGMFLDWELNWWHFALLNNAQPTEPHWSGP